MADSRRADLSTITYLDADADVSRFLESIRSTRELAVDTEGASFHRYVDRVYLIQLSTRSQNAIIDPLAIKPPAALGEMLADAAVEVVFHDADYDLRLLRQDFGWRVAKLFDTRVAAQLLGIRQFGLAALLESHFGVKLDKRHQRADWSQRPLTPDMIEYAAHDTMHLLELRDQLRAQLEKKGRLSWAAEEFNRSRTVEWTPDERDEAFLRMKGARDLTRRELALLRELYAWRERAAAAVDRATFRIVNNDTLLEIARQAPLSSSALMAIKGVPKAWSGDRGADVIAGVERGMAVAEHDLPRFPRGARYARDPDFDTNVNKLRTVRDEIATQLDLDPGVLCARDRLEAVARKKPKSMDELREVTELRAWQVEVLGPAMVAALKA